MFFKIGERIKQKLDNKKKLFSKFLKIKTLDRLFIFLNENKNEEVSDLGCSESDDPDLGRCSESDDPAWWCSEILGFVAGGALSLRWLLHSLFSRGFPFGDLAVGLIDFRKFWMNFSFRSCLYS